MTGDPEYFDAVTEVAGRIRAVIPSDLVETFEKTCAMKKSDFMWEFR
jgi:hypothetical protein